VHILVAVAIVVVGYLWYSRSQELFRIAVRNGKPSLIRGYAPSGLLGRFSDALSNVRQGVISAHKAANGARLSFRGDIDEGTGQRLRNIFGLYPMSQLRAPHIDKRQVVSDAFTLSWLLSILRQFFR
jgi:Protein of unknown function (DUF3634)